MPESRIVGFWHEVCIICVFLPVRHPAKRNKAMFYAQTARAVGDKISLNRKEVFCAALVSKFVVGDSSKGPV